MSHAKKVFAVALLATLAWPFAPVAQAQAPIRIGASVAQTGLYAALGQNTLRGSSSASSTLNETIGGVGLS